MTGHKINRPTAPCSAGSRQQGNVKGRSPTRAADLSPADAGRQTVSCLTAAGRASARCDTNAPRQQEVRA